MNLLQIFNRTFVSLALAVSGAGALAAPITQIWFNTNPDNPQGLFDEVAFHFVSQSNGKTGFDNVAITSPFNGWALQTFDPVLTYAKGASGSQINYALTFDGAASDTVQWDIWYYRDHKKLGGARYSGDVGATAFHFAVLAADAIQPPSSVPEPGTALLVALALGCCAVVRKRRVASLAAQV